FLEVTHESGVFDTGQGEISPQTDWYGYTPQWSTTFVRSVTTANTLVYTASRSRNGPEGPRRDARRHRRHPRRPHRPVLPRRRHVRDRPLRRERRRPASRTCPVHRRRPPYRRPQGTRSDRPADDELD